MPLNTDTAGGQERNNRRMVALYDPGNTTNALLCGIRLHCYGSQLATHVVGDYDFKMVKAQPLRPGMKQSW